MISDPQVTKFLNDRVRIRVMQIRAIQALLADDMKTWAVTTLDKVVTNDATDIDDGRAAEGISVLTGADVFAFIGLAASLLAVMADETMMSAVNKGCIQALGVNIPTG